MLEDPKPSLDRYYAPASTGATDNHCVQQRPQQCVPLALVEQLPRVHPGAGSRQDRAARELVVQLAPGSLDLVSPGASASGERNASDRGGAYRLDVCGEF